jgi:hypothetical protein
VQTLERPLDISEIKLASEATCEAASEESFGAASKTASESVSEGEGEHSVVDPVESTQGVGSHQTLRWSVPNFYSAQHGIMTKVLVQYVFFLHQPFFNLSAPMLFGKPPAVYYRGPGNHVTQELN